MRCTFSVAVLITIFLYTVLIVFLIQPVDILADQTNTTQIMVNISTIAAIEINPTALNWSSVAPGSNSSVQIISLKNIGSTSFAAGVFASVDSWANYTNNPTAGDDVTKYMAGSFLLITNSSFYDTKYWYLNKILWNESTYPEPVNPAGVSWGFFQANASNFLWEINDTVDNKCLNGTNGTTLRIKTTVDAGAGSRNLNTNIAWATYITNDSEWGTWTFTSGPLADYCVATSYDCKRLMIYKFDKNASLPTCGNTTWLSYGSFDPGETLYFYLKVQIPQGAPSGTVTNSTVTFTADTA